jgi:FtsH-binding integral membrane protein
MYSEEADNYDQLGKPEAEDDPLSLDRTNGFIAKVYGILTAQLALTVLITGVTMTSQAVRAFQLQNTWLYILCIVGAVAVQIALVCCGSLARRVPTNYILLGLFTAFESYLVSTVCAAVMESNPDGGQIVLLAAALTFALAGGLTLLATFLNLTGRQFSYVYFVLMVALVGLLGLGIANIFIHNQFLYTLYCCLGVIVFGIYLVIDTALILQGGKWGITTDDYIIAALILYIDIINLFLYILQLLNRR